MPTGTGCVGGSCLCLKRGGRAANIHRDRVVCTAVHVHRAVRANRRRISFTVPTALVPAIACGIGLSRVKRPVRVAAGTRDISPVHLISEARLSDQVGG